MSKREARTLQKSLPLGCLYRPTGRLRSGRNRVNMSETRTEGAGDNPEGEVRVAEAVEELERIHEEAPEMTHRGSVSETDIHQVLEQLARMRELLNGREAELAEVKSELTFARGEAESAQRDAETAQSEAETAKQEVETVKDQLDEAGRHLEGMSQDLQTARMELELQRLRDLEELRKEFDQERKQMRETREREMVEASEWRKELMFERNRLRDRVECLRERLGLSKVPDSEDSGLSSSSPVSIPTLSQKGA